MVGERQKNNFTQTENGCHGRVAHASRGLGDGRTSGQRDGRAQYQAGSANVRVRVRMCAYVLTQCEPSMRVPLTPPRAVHCAPRTSAPRTRARGRWTRRTGAGGWSYRWMLRSMSKRPTPLVSRACRAMTGRASLCRRLMRGCAGMCGGNGPGCMRTPQGQRELMLHCVMACSPARPPARPAVARCRPP